MKYMMQMLTLLLSLSLMAGCSEKEENCEKANPQQEQHEGIDLSSESGAVCTTL